MSSTPSGPGRAVGDYLAPPMVLLQQLQMQAFNACRVYFIEKAEGLEDAQAIDIGVGWWGAAAKTE